MKTSPGAPHWVVIPLQRWPKPVGFGALRSPREQETKCMGAEGKRDVNWTQGAPFSFFAPGCHRVPLGDCAEMARVPTPVPALPDRDPAPSHR